MFYNNNVFYLVSISLI